MLFFKFSSSFFTGVIGSMLTAMRVIWEVLMLMVLSFFSKAKTAVAAWPGYQPSCINNINVGEGYCLSWRLTVEAGNVRGWRTVPAQCVGYVESYMLGGQYKKDVEMVVEQICAYSETILRSEDGKDAWILDVDDTCLSNLFFYAGKRFG